MDLSTVNTTKLVYVIVDDKPHIMNVATGVRASCHIKSRRQRRCRYWTRRRARAYSTERRTGTSTSSTSSAQYQRPQLRPSSSSSPRAKLRPRFLQHRLQRQRRSWCMVASGRGLSKRREKSERNTTTLLLFKMRTFEKSRYILKLLLLGLAQLLQRRPRKHDVHCSASWHH